ncbi:MAG: hypothetical protein WCI74_12660 [Actinomycetes bacterium]
MNPEMKAKFAIDRYKPLGLVANPFAMSESATDFTPIDLEISSQANPLLATIDQVADDAQTKPIVVIKNPELPAFFPNRAISHVERSLATDNGLDVLHVYVMLFMMRMGRVRATLRIVAERIAFRSFDVTLGMYAEKVLSEPDEDLIAFQVLGAEGLESFKVRFEADRTQALADVFGIPKGERRPELAEVADMRLTGLEPDVQEDDAEPELDATIGDAPGTEVIISDELTPEEDADRAILDYFVEYTKVHLSPVVARGIRVYHDCGLAALATELTVTKAPRKTLAALVKFARVRYRKMVLIYDGFESWARVPGDLRSQIAGTLAEMRWMLQDDACIVMMLERDGVPELEEQFGGGVRLEWDFPSLVALEESPDVIDVDMLDRWIAAAGVAGQTPLTLGDPVLSALLAEAEGSLSEFCISAWAAIENAAERGVSALDEDALGAGRAASRSEGDSE